MPKFILPAPKRAHAEAFEATRDLLRQVLESAQDAESDSEDDDRLALGDEIANAWHDVVRAIGWVAPKLAAVHALLVADPSRCKECGSDRTDHTRRCPDTGERQWTCMECDAEWSTRI